MNYKRKQPAYRKLRRSCGYVGMGIENIRKQIDRDYFDKAFDSVKEYHFNKRVL